MLKLNQKTISSLEIAQINTDNQKENIILYIHY